MEVRVALHAEQNKVPHVMQIFVFWEPRRSHDVVAFKSYRAIPVYFA
jgi:hypothetical protein